MAGCEVHLYDSLKITLTFLDCDRNVLDVSAASSQEVILRGPTTRINESSSFVTDGTDGKVTVDIATGQINEIGTWKVQGHINLTGVPDVEYRSEILTFSVDDNI